MATQPHRTAAGLNAVASLASLRETTKRRQALRIEVPFLATVRGVERSGERFVTAAVLDNLSTTGLYLRLAWAIAPGTPIFVVVRFAIDPCHAVAAPGVAARGVVLRAEQCASGAWGVAIQFIRHRFLYAGTAWPSHHC